MRRNLKNHIFKLWGLKLFIIIIIIVGLMIGVSTCNENKKMTGNEWFEEQYTYMNTLTLFCEQMDKVYSLYLSGNMSESDFITQHDLLQKQYVIMESDYENWLNQHPIKTGSHSYVSKRGENAIISFRKDIKDLLDNTFSNGAPLDMNSMTYVYLSYNEKIKDDLVEYVVAFRWFVESEHPEEDMDKLITQWNNYIDSKGE